MGVEDTFRKIRDVGIEIRNSNDMGHSCTFVKKIPSLFFVYFHLFKRTLQILQQIHLVYYAGIRTHDLRKMSLLT